MALVPTQVSVGTTAQLLVSVPPGPCTVVLVCDTSSTGPVYIGTSTAVTASNGFPLDATGLPLPLSGHNTSSGTSLYGICASGKAATVGVFISNGA